MSWWQITRLGLVQAAIGAVVVLLTTTINRVIVVELGLPASVPGLLVALHFGVQLILRPRLGHDSDRSGSRTPWIVGGLVVCAVSGVGVAASLPIMRTNPVLGIALASLASVILGAGVSAAGTPLLALMSERATPSQRAGAAAITWILMIVGIIITAATSGALLDPFSYSRLLAIAAGIGGAGVVISVLATWGIERRTVGAPRAAAMDVSVSLDGGGFGRAFRAVWAEPAARAFASFVFLAMLAYSAQDLILEPFAGIAFGMTPGESTKLSGTHHGGVLVGMVVSALVATRTGQLRHWAAAGCLASAITYVALTLTPAIGDVRVFRAVVPLLGVANGVFAIGAIGSMMALADVATRERFHLSDERLAQLYRTARSEIVTEAALIATCNRTELYAWVDSDDMKVVERAVQSLARRWMRTRAEGDALLHTATQRFGEHAARHVVRIASGLESQVLGDGQILGQLRTAYKRASHGHAAGPVLHRLFETALRAGKRVTTETSLSAGRNSVGAEAAVTASQRFGNLQNARCVVVGAGKTGTRAAKQLHKLGARDLVIINRTFERAQQLAKFVGGRAAPMDAVHIEAAMADVVIIATASEVPVLTDAPLRHAREACASSGYSLLLMDLGVPRNIDARIQHQTGVTLIDLDTLHQPILDAEEMRREAIPVASRICEDEISAFMDWLATMPARDAIKPLRDALQGVARREVAFAAGDEQVAERAASRIVAKLLAGPMAALRKAVQRGEPLDAQAMMLFEMFAPAVGEAARSPRGGRHGARATERAVERVVTERPVSDRPARPALREAVRDAAPTLHGTLREQFS